MRRGRSVFFRVYAILLCATLAVTILAALGFVLQFRQREGPGLKAHAYARSADGQVLASTDDPELLDKARALEAGGRSGVGRDGRAPFAIVRGGSGFFLIYGSPFLDSRRPLLPAAVIIILAGISMASYMSMRTVLAPLKKLGLGVAALRVGDLSFRINVDGDDEFADLAVSFNELADRVEYQLEIKEQLLLDVSHELRSPLTHMALEAEFVQDEQLRGSLREDILELEKKIGQLLLSSRLDSPYGVPKLETVDAEDFLQNAVYRFRGMPPGIRFAQPSEPIPLRADPDLLDTVVRNVLENALRYSLPESPPVEVSLGTSRGAVEIVVRDHGSGIPGNAEERVFEPFYRADPSRDRSSGGFGIGLYLCKRIMEAHKGGISLRNAEGGGAEARLWLPA